MEILSFGKNFRVGRNWNQEGITEEEEEALQEIVESKNEVIMQRSFEIAEKIIAKYSSPSSDNLDVITAVACRIYESNRINAQSFFESYIRRKVYLLRNGYINSNGGSNGISSENDINGEEKYE